MATDGKTYLAEKNVKTLMTEMVAQLVLNQPTDEVSFLIEFLKKQKGGSVSVATTNGTAASSALADKVAKFKFVDARSDLRRLAFVSEDSGRVDGAIDLGAI